MEGNKPAPVSVSTTGQHRSLAVVAGALIGAFQLVGRTHIGQFIGAGGGSAFGELRLWIMLALSLWLLAAAAVIGPRFDRFKLGEVRTSGRLIVLFVMYMITTTFWAPDLARAQDKAYDLVFVAWSCALTVASIGFFGYRATMEGFCYSLFGFGLVLAGSGLIAASSSGYISASSRGEEVRLATFGGGPNVYGRNMGLLTLAAVWFVLDGKKWLRRPAAVVAPVAVLLVFLSGSRGAMLALFIGLIAYLSSRRWDRRIGRAVVFVVLAGLAALATQVGHLAVKVFQERFIVLLLVEGYFTYRDTLLVDGITAGLRHPLGGLGLAGFAQLGSVGNYPHNMFVEAFSEGGTFGITLLFLPFVIHLRRWRRGMGAGDAVAVAGLMLLGVSSSISGDLFDARGVFLLLLLTLASQEAREGRGTTRTDTHGVY